MSEPSEGGFNVNDFVWVRLTELGWKVYDDRHRQLGLDPAPYRRHIGGPEGFQRFQLWDLMATFGPHMVMGLDCHFFDRLTIWFNDPAAVSPSSGTRET